MDGKPQPSLSLVNWRFSSKAAPNLEDDNATPLASQRLASRSASTMRLREAVARGTPALRPMAPASPTSIQTTGDKIWPKSPSSSAKRKIIPEGTSQGTQTPPNLLNFLRRNAHARSAPVARVTSPQLPGRGEAQLSRRLPRHASEQRTRMQSPSEKHLNRRHTIAASGASAIVPRNRNNTRPTGKNRRDSAMPCSWVSDSGSVSSNEEAQAPVEAPPASLNPKVNVAQLAAPDPPDARTNLEPTFSTPLRGRLQTLPALSASTVSLADLSDGWDTDAESSPVRRDQSNKQEHKKPERRLRRMTIHDNLAKLQLGFGGESHDRSLSEYSPHHIVPAVILAVGQKEIGPSSSLYSVRPVESPDRTSGETVGGQSSSPGSKTSELLTFFTYHQQGKGTSADKPLPSPPTSQEPGSSKEQACKCDCSETVREEMALVRAELASLRKALWVFGSRVEASEWRDVVDGDIAHSPIASDVAFAGCDAIGGRWAEEEPRGRPRRRSS